MDYAVRYGSARRTEHINTVWKTYSIRSQPSSLLFLYCLTLLILMLVICLVLICHTMID